MDSSSNLLGIIDHSLLQPEATPGHIAALCEEATEYGFATVCVNTVYVPLAVRLLAGTGVRVCTPVGYPLGANNPAVKAYEAEQAIAQGAQEIDMVIHIGALKARQLRELHHDIAAVVLACHAHEGVVCKVIIETALLSDEEKTIACQVAKEVRADFVKTSTGFAGDGATVETVQLMRSVVGDNVGVAASGDITTVAEARALLGAGASRLGTFHALAIARELRGEAPATRR